MRTFGIFSTVLLLLFSGCSESKSGSSDPKENYIKITIDGVTETFYGATAKVEANGDFTNTSIEYRGKGDDDILFLFSGRGEPKKGDYSNDNAIEIIRITAHKWEYIGKFPNLQVSEFDKKVVGTFSGELEQRHDGPKGSSSGEFNINL